MRHPGDISYLITTINPNPPCKYTGHHTTNIQDITVQTQNTNTQYKHTGQTHRTSHTHNTQDITVQTHSTNTQDITVQTHNTNTQDITGQTHNTNTQDKHTIQTHSTNTQKMFFIINTMAQQIV